MRSTLRIAMAGSNLTDEELREAAAEAGISPHELRLALAERQGGNLPARTPAAGALAHRAGSQLESQLALPRREAVETVRQSIERQTGKRGHWQGDDRFDVVDEDAGLNYRVSATEDGAGGALVRVELDPSQGKGSQALATTGVAGITVTLLSLGWLFGAVTLLLGGLGIGALGGLLIARSVFKLRRSMSDANAVAAQALMDADDRASLSLKGSKS